MEKQFVPYELALKFKELGFDEECLAYWDDDLEFELNNEYLRGSQMDESWLTAPLWQQAFFWIISKVEFSDWQLTLEPSGWELFDLIDKKWYLNDKALEKLIEIVELKTN